MIATSMPIPFLNIDPDAIQQAIDNLTVVVLVFITPIALLATFFVILYRAKYWERVGELLG